MSKKEKIYLVEPGFSEPTLLYEVKLKLVEKLDGATMGDVAERLDELGVTKVILENSYPDVIDWLKSRFLVSKILIRRTKEEVRL